MRKIVRDWQKTGEYPKQTMTKTQRKRGGKAEVVYMTIPLSQAELLQQLANEMSAIALIKAESSMTGAGATKLASESGWFLNIEAEVEKFRAYTEERIDRQLRGGNSRRPASADPDIPEFEADQEVDDDFTGETEKATEGTEPAASPVDDDEPVSDPEPGAVV